MHRLADGQDTRVSCATPAGGPLTIQCWPPSLVREIASPLPQFWVPTATQCCPEEHEMLESDCRRPVTRTTCQVAPASPDRSTMALSAGPVVPPAAKHVSWVGQA